MKLLHTADLHLGMRPDKGSPWSETRAQALWDALAHIIEAANTASADLLLIAGDLFHRQPLLRDLKEVNAMFDSLTTARVVLIAGNHDYIGPRSHYRDFVWSDHVYFLKGSDPESVSIEDLNVEIHGLSYHQAEVRQPLYDGWQAPRDGRIHILLGHGGDDRHSPVDVRRLAASGFHYIALGHIHKPELREELRLAWCGAPEPMDRTDMGERGYIEANVTLRQTRLRFIPLSDVRYIPMTVTVTPDTTRESLRRTLRSHLEQHGLQHIYLLTLQGERDPDLDLTAPVPLEGQVIQWTDHTHIALDYDHLKQLHSRDLLGQFLTEMEQLPPGPLRDKAMAYGARACLWKGGHP